MNSKTKPNKLDKEKNVQVFVRVRPMNALEKARPGPSVVLCNGSKEIIVREKPADKISKTFTYDRVFGPDSKQIEIYRTIVHPLIDEVLSGYNCTVFAYGQTGTGKTFTMEGEKSENLTVSWEEDPLSGIIPRSLSHLFDELRLLEAEYTVRVSFLELYNEEIFDLLSPTDDPSKLKLYDDQTRKGSVIIHGLEEVTVHNKQDVYKIMTKGALKRTTAATLMNAQSSRSHTVFSITVHIKENSIEGEELLKTGKLNLVDLAGSENISRSGAVAGRAREAGNINQSLLTLGRCITSLTEHCPHIPYRESKLTRLLQESLGGRTKTSIIATVSPALVNIEETLSTLDYAHRAKDIKNKPEINQKLTKKALLKEYTEEIERLRRDLEAAREKNGIFIASENYAHMIEKLQQQEDEVINKISAMKALHQEMEKKEELCNALQMNLTHARDEILKCSIENEEQSYLIGKHVETENKLRQQALTLSNTLDESTKDTEKLHKKLDCKRKIEAANIEATNTFSRKLREETKNLNCVIDCLRSLCSFFNDQSVSLVKFCELEDGNIAQLCESFTKLSAAENDFNAYFSSLDEQNKFFKEFTNGQQIAALGFLNSFKKTIMDSQTIMNEDFPTLENELRTVLLMQCEIQKSLQCNVNILRTIYEDIIVLKNKISTMHQNLEPAVEIIKTDLRNMKFNLIEAHKLRQASRKEFAKEFNDLLKRHQENAEQLDNRLLTEGISSIDGVHHEVAENQVFAEIENIVDQHSVYCEKLSDCTNIFSTPLEKLNMVTKKVKCCHSLSIDTKQKTQAVEDEKMNILSMFSKHLDEFGNTACNSDYFKNIETHQNEAKSNLKVKFNVAIQNLKRQTQEMKRTHHDFTSEELSKVKEQLMKCDASIKCVEHTATKQLDMVDNFVNKDFQLDIQTGQTPQRRNWQYPKELVCMSPHERILNRFRKEKQLLNGGVERGSQVENNKENILQPIPSPEDN